MSIMLSAVRFAMLFAFCCSAVTPELAHGQASDRMGPAPSLEGRFKPPFYPTGIDPGNTIVADINGDGNLDMVSGARSNAARPVVRVRLGKGDGTFGERVDFESLFEPGAIAAGDLNNDGRLDLLVGYSGGNSKSSRFMSSGVPGSTALSFDRTDFDGSITRSVAIADLDNNGKQDMVIATNRGNVGIFWGIGNDQFVTGSAPATGPYRIVIVDLDQDGLLDIAAVDDGNSMSVTRNLGARSFGPALTIPFGSFSQPWKPGHLAVGDVDRDGDVDIVTSNYSAASVTVFKQAGNTLDFQIYTTFHLRAGSRPSAILLRDFNEDLHPDIAVALESHEVVTLLENLNGGQFNTGIDLIADTGTTTLTLADLDSNGCIDMLAGSEGGISVLRNLSCDPNPLCLSDLNRDGVINTADLIIFLGDFGTVCP